MRTPSSNLLVGTAVSVCVSLLAVVHAQSKITTWRISDVPAELRPAVSRADVIITTMHDALLWELNSGLEQGGAQLAIKSCHIDSTRVAQRVGRQEGIAAGRTSDRLRNPLNAPRPWAAPLVAEYAGQPAKAIDGLVADLGDKLGVMRPIAHRPSCAGCHGQREKFSTAINAELRDRYPADRAIGFEEGEIRGWYWVEIPKHPR